MMYSINCDQTVADTLSSSVKIDSHAAVDLNWKVWLAMDCSQYTAPFRASQTVGNVYLTSCSLPTYTPSTLHSRTQAYTYMIRDRDHVHNLRSATMSLSQPSFRTTLANSAFRCSAPAVWNSLPKTVVDSDSVAVFKSKLKTFLFSQAYSLSSSHS